MCIDGDFVFLLQVTTACSVSEVVVSPDGKLALSTLMIFWHVKGGLHAMRLDIWGASSSEICS
jgi:hypothetical protein